MKFCQYRFELLLCNVRGSINKYACYVGKYSDNEMKCTNFCCEIGRINKVTGFSPIQDW